MTGLDGNNLVSAEVRREVLAHLELACDVAMNGDDPAAASVARRELPGLVAGLRALLAEHVFDVNGYCRTCRSSRWWRRTPGPCTALLTFRLGMTRGTEAPRARHRRLGSP